MHAESGTLYATRWGGTGPQKTGLATATSDATLAGDGDDLLVVYVDRRSDPMQARTSGDGGRTWSQPVMFGVRPAGPPLPTACVYRQQGRLLNVAAWSAQPSESDGPLVIAIHDGTQWLPPVEHGAIRSSGASLHCTENGGAEIVWRDHRQGSTGPNVSLWMARVSHAGALEDERRILTHAFDPSFCRSGDRRWVAHHSAINDAHLAVSDDGLLWNEVDTDGAQAGLQPLDETGKYAAVACVGQIVLATWGDWPTKADADARTDTRRVGAA